MPMLRIQCLTVSSMASQTRMPRKWAKRRTRCTKRYHLSFLCKARGILLERPTLSELHVPSVGLCVHSFSCVSPRQLRCFSSYMSMQCSSIFPRCTTPQSRDEPMPVGGRVPMCLHLCVPHMGKGLTRRPSSPLQRSRHASRLALVKLTAVLHRCIETWMHDCYCFF